MASRTYTTEQAAEELDVDASLIRKWKHRGRVRPVDQIPGAVRGGVVPLYDLEDLRPLVDQYRAQQQDDTP